MREKIQTWLREHLDRRSRGARVIEVEVRGARGGKRTVPVEVRARGSRAPLK